ncbi:porin family protein [Halomonas dongshanensis]|uniref:Porin family protein n=1 Tax=Halomonas dongshanensis TaxID=2890835 RepID=A0ABT2EDD4_9GAMM|nr:porin family protein [Halomonas dongshanensis]MCS2609565.1 porin family protein [Halomonas dongshanensis]
MKKTLLSVTTLCALVGAGAFATTAQAQQSFGYPQGYVGGDAMFWNLDPDNGSSRDDVGLRLRGGAQFNDYFALEGHVGTGGSDGGAELDYLVGAYAKGIAPITPDFRVYGLVGMTEVDFDIDRESGFSYGAGAEVDVADNLAIGADYMRYLDKSAYDFDAASVGLRYRF